VWLRENWRTTEQIGSTCINMFAMLGSVLQELFLDDMIAIRRLLAFASPKHLFTLGQLEKQLETECDYRVEAAALHEVADNMTVHGLMPREVVVPRPVQELTTGRMLVMELLDGLKLTEATRRTVAAQVQVESNTVADNKSEPASQKQAPSPLAVGDALMSTYRTLVWLLRCCTGSVSYGDGTGSDTAAAAANVARMVDILMRVHGAQLLRDGLFNADPNGGNFLLLRDGRIGLLDFGATKRLTREERLLGAVSAQAQSG
jgi:hypothetical protein